MSSEIGKAVTMATLLQIRLQARIRVRNSHVHMYTLQKVHLDLSLKIKSFKDLGNFTKSNVNGFIKI